MIEQFYSPLEGELIKLEEVDDEMFSQKMLGDGVAIIPIGDKLYSPVDGIVTMVYETKHAIGIKSNGGKDLLIHIGIDTVNLNGKPFKTKVNVGDKVKKGDLLTVVDWKYIKAMGCDTVVPLIMIGNPIEINGKCGKIRVGDSIFTA